MYSLDAIEGGSVLRARGGEEWKKENDGDSRERGYNGRERVERKT